MERSEMNKKELKRHYKENPRPTGIFQIKNLLSGKIFIGSAIDVNGIINSNKFQLLNRSHMNKELQQDFIIAGEENFSFEILDILEPKDNPIKDYEDDLEVLLQMWIEKLQPFDKNGYHKRKQK
jgi:hypothetical protein